MPVLIPKPDVNLTLRQAYDIKFTPDAAERILEIQTALDAAAEVVDEARTLTVTDDATDVRAAEIISLIAKNEKTLEALRKYFTTPLDSRKRQIDKFFKEWLAERDRVDTRLRSEHEAHFIKKMADARAAEAKRQADIAQQAKAARALGMAAPAPAPTVAAVAPPKTMETDAGKVTIKMVTDYRVVDFKIVPDEYKLLNEKTTRDAVRAGVHVPGIEVFQRPETAAR